MIYNVVFRQKKEQAEIAQMWEARDSIPGDFADEMDVSMFEHHEHLVNLARAMVSNATEGDEIEQIEQIIGELKDLKDNS